MIAFGEWVCKWIRPTPAVRTPIEWPWTNVLEVLAGDEI